MICLFRNSGDHLKGYLAQSTLHRDVLSSLIAELCCGADNGYIYIHLCIDDRDSALELNFENIASRPRRISQKLVRYSLYSIK